MTGAFRSAQIPPYIWQLEWGLRSERTPFLPPHKFGFKHEKIYIYNYNNNSGDGRARSSNLIMAPSSIHSRARLLAYRPEMNGGDAQAIWGFFQPLQSQLLLAGWGWGWGTGEAKEPAICYEHITHIGGAPHVLPLNVQPRWTIWS